MFVIGGCTVLVLSAECVVSGFAPPFTLAAFAICYGNHFVV
jgi:hypothetical protein